MSTCVYPANADLPLKEASLHAGTPHPSNFGYAYAKRALDVQSRAYRQQYGCNFITAIPNNLFGENDNFDLENSHVIPAIIRKIYEAKKNNKNVVLWGDGSPLREFTYAKDMARVLMFVLENYNEESPINVGNTKEYSIKQVADTIAEIMGFEGNLKMTWDIEKPAGQHRKPSCSNKLEKLGWNKGSFTSFEASLRSTCEWFAEKYPNVRGI
jgi:GDP-L-fucose synthase